MKLQLLLLAVALAQTTPVRITSPTDQTHQVGMSTMSDGGRALEVHAESVQLADGGVITAAQGLGQDGGAWNVDGPTLLTIAARQEEQRRMLEQILVELQQANQPR